MFEETYFDACEDEDTATPQTEKGRPKRKKARGEGATKKVPASGSSGAGVTIAGQYRFHAPGEPGFSPVASTASVSAGAAKFDESFACGELWTSRTCHCLRCDVVRVMNSMRIQNIRGPLILLDLDNYGFPQLKSHGGRAGSVASVAKMDPFVWCFYGACFSRHFSVNPEEFVEKTSTSTCSAEAPSQQHTGERQVGQKARRSGKTTSGSANGASEEPEDRARVGSLWHTLGTQRRVCFTPCGGHTQSVDEAMMAVLAAMVDLEQPLVVVTCDNDMLRHAREVAGSACTNPGADGPLNRLLMNPQRYQRQIVPLWNELCSFAELNHSEPQL